MLSESLVHHSPLVLWMMLTESFVMKLWIRWARGGYYEKWDYCEKLLWQFALPVRFSTNRQSNNIMNCEATWLHNRSTEEITLKYFKDETRLCEKAKRAILCLWNQLFLFILCWDWTHIERNINFFHCEHLARIMPKEWEHPPSSHISTVGFLRLCTSVWC